MVRFTATGASMAPAIRAGDVLRVEPVAPTAVRLGDVVLYASLRGLTAHRVVEASDSAGMLRCRGDARGSELESVRTQEVLGRVTGVEAGETWRALPLLRLGLRLLGLGARSRALLPEAKPANPAKPPEVSPIRTRAAAHGVSSVRAE